MQDLTFVRGTCFILPLLALLAASAPSAAAQEFLQPFGGPGGGQFQAGCGPNEALVGINIRTGDDVDAARPICAVTLGATSIDRVATLPDWNGGGSGPGRVLQCPTSAPVVIAIYVGYEGEVTRIVNNLWLYCGLVTVAQQLPGEHPNAIFDGPGYTPSTIGFNSYPALHFGDIQQCPRGEIAVGIHGRSGIWLDAIGLICGAPSSVGAGNAAPSPRAGPFVTSIGKVVPKVPARTGTATMSADRTAPGLPALTGPLSGGIGKLAPAFPTGVLPPICTSAAAARARHSPAAPNLEAQCRAAMR